MEHIIWVKQFLLDLFSKGKGLEIRTGSRFSKSIRVGDVFSFNRKIRRRVKAIRVYSSFPTMLDCEDSNHIYPDANKDKILTGLRNIYTPKQENQGVIVFELEQC